MLSKRARPNNNRSWYEAALFGRGVMEPAGDDSEETRALLEQAEQGQAIFDRLFARHEAALRQAIAWRLDAGLQARVDASDVLQETHLEAFQRLADYLQRRPMPFRLWLRKTAQQRLLMLERQHRGVAQRSVNREIPLPDKSSLLLGERFAASGPSPSQEVNRRQLVDHVRRAVAELGEADREILLMRHFEGLSYEEIAWILEIDPATARKRNGRALLRLHKLLSEQGMTQSQL